MDPIVLPGKYASHMHAFCGSDAVPRRPAHDSGPAEGMPIRRKSKRPISLLHASPSKPRRLSRASLVIELC